MYLCMYVCIYVCIVNATRFRLGLSLDVGLGLNVGLGWDVAGRGELNLADAAKHCKILYFLRFGELGVASAIGQKLQNQCKIQYFLSFGELGVAS